MRRESLLIFLCLASFTAGCAASGQAQWSQTREDDRYLYVPGVATGAPTLQEGKRLAVNNAVSEIVPYFGYTSKVQYEEKRTELCTKVMDDFSAASKGTKVKEGILHNWRYERNQALGGYDVFVVVRFSRQWIQEEKTRQRTEENERAFLVLKALKAAATAESCGDVQAALAEYVQALRLTGGTAGNENLHAQAASGLTSLAARLRLESVSGNRQDGELFEGLPSPFVVRATIGGYPGGTPVRGLPVVFSAADGRASLMQEERTNTEGLISARVDNVDSLSPRNRIRAVLDAGRVLVLPPDLSADDSTLLASTMDLLRKQEVEFVFSSHVSQSPRVILRIEETNLDERMTDSIVSSELSRRLVDTGFRIESEPGSGLVGPEGTGARDTADRADFLISGRVVTRVSGVAPYGMKCVLADAFIDVVSLKDGKVVSRQQEIGIRGFGGTEREAGIRALQKAARTCAGSILEDTRQAAKRQRKVEEKHEANP